MSEYIIKLSKDQVLALNNIAKGVNKTPQEVIDEQVSFYIKKMLTIEVEQQGINISGIEDIQTDQKQAEFLARLLNAKEDLLNELKD